jgi:hypothetical protein
LNGNVRIGGRLLIISRPPPPQEREDPPQSGPIQGLGILRRQKAKAELLEEIKKLRDWQNKIKVRLRLLPVREN